VSTLHLSLKGEYFRAIEANSKTLEFRLVTPYWTKRLVGRHYDSIELTLGYPARDDESKRLRLPYRGYVRTTITHPHFGPGPVEVFAIDVDRYPPVGA